MNLQVWKLVPQGMSSSVVTCRSLSRNLLCLLFSLVDASVIEPIKPSTSFSFALTSSMSMLLRYSFALLIKVLLSSIVFAMFLFCSVNPSICLFLPSSSSFTSTMLIISAGMESIFSLSPCRNLPAALI